MPTHTAQMPQLKSTYSLAQTDDPTVVEFTVHVASGHHWRNTVWTEDVTPEISRLFAEFKDAEDKLKATVARFSSASDADHR